MTTVNPLTLTGVRDLLTRVLKDPILAPRDRATVAVISPRGGCGYTNTPDSCSNMPPDVPHCIVGAILKLAGADLSLLGASYWQPKRVSVGSLQITPEASAALTIMQRLQDNGATWGTCEVALKAYMECTQV